MTAVIGFTCHDGVLMMADTEETTSVDTKSECDKLYHFPFPTGTILTGGAGDGHLIDCANQELHQFFATGGPETSGVSLDGELIRAALNAFAQRFFGETTAQYIGMDPLPSFEMLIAVNHHKKQTLLFRWVQNRMLWIAPARHDCIGYGIIQLHPMLQDFQFIPTRETALFCGIRMMFHAKRIVKGVGGKTEAVALLNDGTVIYSGTKNTQRIEELVASFEEFLGNFVYTTVSNVTTGVKGLEKNVAQTFADFPKRFHEYRERYKELLDNPEM